MNWNVILDTLHGCISIGIIVRDHKGYELATKSTNKFAILELEVTEALAAVHAAAFNRDLRLQKNHNGGRCNANYEINGSKL